MKASYTALIVLALAGLFLLPSGSARADWVPSAELAGGIEGTAYHGETVTFSYTLSIGSISRTSSVEIRSFTMKLDWETTSLELAPRTVVYTLPGTHTFTRTVVVPDFVVDGRHSASIVVEGKANGDLWASSETWTDSFVVGTRPELYLGLSANPTSGPSPMSVTFTANPSGGTPPYAYQFNYGDGQTGEGMTHIYSTAGTYVATLTVTDDLGRTIQATCSIITYTPLAISGGADANNGKAPITVRFTSTASGGSPAYSYLWTFGDGSSSVEMGPSHRYSESGTYEVTLIVTDSQSRQSTYHTTIIVQPGDMGSSVADLGGSGTLLIGIIAIALAAVAVLAIVVVRKRKKKS